MYKTEAFVRNNHYSHEERHDLPFPLPNYLSTSSGIQFHVIIAIDSPTGDQLSLGEIVGRFKSYTTKQYIIGVGKCKCQHGYYDHIIRNKPEICT